VEAFEELEKVEEKKMSAAGGAGGAEMMREE